jgi:hypothetical protein
MSQSVFLVAVNGRCKDELPRAAASCSSRLADSITPIWESGKAILVQIVLSSARQNQGDILEEYILELNLNQCYILEQYILESNPDTWNGFRQIINPPKFHAIATNI